MSEPVTVLGAGVSGLTVAVTLLEEGWPVVVVAAEPAATSTSGVAAAMWHPFYQAPDHSYLLRAMHSYRRLDGLAKVPGSGVVRRRLTEFTDQDSPPWWMAAVAEEGKEVVSVRAGLRRRRAYQTPIPLADTTGYLGYLEDRVRWLGGSFDWRLVTDLAAESARAHTVINCTGYGSAALAADGELGLVRGVVLRCAKVTGVVGCFIDDTDPIRPTYIVERLDDLILGGSAEPGIVGNQPTQALINDIRSRCEALLPVCADAQTLEVRVGFRAVRRDGVRVQRDPLLPNVIHNYGHGGAGFTLSWGCAREVAALVHPVQIPR